MSYANKGSKLQDGLGYFTRCNLCTCTKDGVNRSSSRISVLSTLSRHEESSWNSSVVRYFSHACTPSRRGERFVLNSNMFKRES